MRQSIVALAGALLVGGCAGDPPPAGVPMGIQLLRVDPWLDETRFSVVLNFEVPSDAVFVDATPHAAVARPDRAHTGGMSLALPAGTTAATIKLHAVLNPALAFPDGWTMAGAYLYSPVATRVTVQYVREGKVAAQRQVPLAAGAWTPAMLDLTEIADTSAPAGAVVFVFSEPLRDVVYLDDVLLVDNNEWIIGDSDMSDNPPGMWTIRQLGHRYELAAPSLFTLSIPTAGGSAAGWRLEEANALRARFSSARDGRTLTVYPDGRSFEDGTFKPAGDAQGLHRFAAAHRAPGTIEIDESQGRAVRNSAGDENNDGYNEARGAYTVRAEGARVTFQLLPTASPLPAPVIELSGLPAGAALVTVEGQLVETHTRLADGTLLLKLPMTLERPTAVSVRVQ